MLGLSKKKNNSPATTEEGEMGFLQHLEELRWHLIRSILAIVIFAIIFYILESWVFDNIIFWPKQNSFPTYEFFCSLSEATCFRPPLFGLQVKELGEQFFTSLKVCMSLGFIVSFPYIFWEFWQFLKPGLYPGEQKAARGIVAYCSSLFIAGALFGYFVISPFAINFLVGYNLSDEIIIDPTLASYVSYLTMFTIPTGIVFELPIVVYFLSKVGILTPDFMRTYRKHALIIILILASIITPPDVTSQFLIGIPLFILYEISIHISRRVEKANQLKENS